MTWGKKKCSDASGEEVCVGIFEKKFLGFLGFLIFFGSSVFAGVPPVESLQTELALFTPTQPISEPDLLIRARKIYSDLQELMSSQVSPATQIFYVNHAEMWLRNSLKENSNPELKALAQRLSLVSETMFSDLDLPNLKEFLLQVIRYDVGKTQLELNQNFDTNGWTYRHFNALEAVIPKGADSETFIQALTEVVAHESRSEQDEISHLYQYYLAVIAGVTSLDSGGPVYRQLVKRLNLSPDSIVKLLLAFTEVVDPNHQEHFANLLEATVDILIEQGHYSDALQTMITFLQRSGWSLLEGEKFREHSYWESLARSVRYLVREVWLNDPALFKKMVFQKELNLGVGEVIEPAYHPRTLIAEAFKKEFAITDELFFLKRFREGPSSSNFKMALKMTLSYGLHGKYTSPVVLELLASSKNKGFGGRTTAQIIEHLSHDPYLLRMLGWVSNKYPRDKKLKKRTDAIVNLWEPEVTPQVMWEVLSRSE